MDIIIKKQELENISSLLPTIIYNELLKFTEEPISIEGDVTSPTTESVVETKIDKSVLLIKIKLFKKALEKDKSNKVLKIKIKLFEKELTKYAKGGGVERTTFEVFDGLKTIADFPTKKEALDFCYRYELKYPESKLEIKSFKTPIYKDETFKYAKGGGVEAKISREFSNLKNGVKASYEKLFTEIVDSLESDFDVNRGVAFKKVFNTKNWDKTKKFLNDGYAPNQVAEMFYKGEFGNMKYEEGGMMAKGGGVGEVKYFYIKGRNEYAPQKLKDTYAEFYTENDLIEYLNKWKGNKDVSFNSITKVYNNGESKDVTDFYLKNTYSKGGEADGWKAGTTTKFKTKKEALESLELLKYHNESSKEFRILGLKKIEGDKLNEGWVVNFEYKIKYANGGGVGDEYTYEIKSEVSIQNQGKKFEKRMNVWGGNVFVNGKSKVFIPFGYDTKEEAEARAKKIIEELKKGKFKGYNLITERLLDKYSRGYANGGGVEDVVITIESGNDGELEEVWRGKNTIKNQPIYNSLYKNEIKKGKTVFLYENGVLMYSDFADLDEGYYKNGGGVDYNENREMVLNDNKQIAHHTKELQSAVKGKNVPAWVVAKVNRSASDLSDSTHYMEGQGESYADGGSIKIGDKVMLPEIKMRDGKIQFEKVENGEVIEIQDGIYSVLNPKTNRIHQVSLNQIKFNNGGSLEEILAKKRAELNSYSDERIAKLFSDLMDIDYTDTLIELEGNAGERRYMIKELMDELTIRHKNKFEGGGVFNGKYLDTISSDKKNKILKNIANNYGFSIAEALAEVVDADAEMLYEYISNDQSLRMSVYNDIEGGKFADGGGVGNPSKKEMLDYLNMYFDNYSELRTIAIEEDNILTRKMLNSLDNEELEMAYDDAKYEIKADTQFNEGGGVGKMSNEMYEKLDKITDWKIIKQKKHPLRSKIFLTLSQSGNYYRIAPLSNGKIVNRTATYFTQKELAEKDYESTIKKYFVNDIEGGKFAKGGGTSKIWIVNIAMPTSNNNMPKLIKKEIELGRMSNEFDVKQAILRKGRDWLGNGNVLTVYEKK